MAAWICWLCGLLAVYVVAGYPLLLALLTRFRPRPWRRAFAPLPVAVLMPVRNGERWLQAKLESLLALDYPADKLRILVLSDASIDGTESIARAYAHRGVEFYDLPSGGKSAALNAGLKLVPDGVLFLTDVRQPLSPNSLRDLVACLGDPTVGAASGELILRDGDSGETRNVGLYWKYEKFIRRRQALVDSVPGATGAIYVIRRELARPIPPDVLLDDVYLPVGALRQGFRVVFEDKAVAYDDTATLDAEFGRKVRTQGGVWQLLQLEPWLLGPGNRIWLHFLSHKVGRLLLPFALAAFLLASPWTPAPWPYLLLAAQALFYGLALADPVCREGNPLKRLTGPARTFLTLMFAAVAGMRVFWVPARELWRPAGAATPLRRLAPGWARALTLAVSLAFLAAGVTFLLSGAIPFAPVKVLIDRRAADGSADGFTLVLFQAIIGRLQRAGGALLLYGVVLWLLRPRLAAALGRLPERARRMGRVFAGAFRRYWRTAPGWERWGMAAVLAIGLGVRLLYIQYPLRHDEAWTVDAYARAPVFRLLTDFHDPNNHLLHTLSIHLSIGLFGETEWAVRLPALLAGWLAIAAAYVFFRRQAGGAAGVLAAALLAAQSAQIEYSVLSRGYSTVVLLFLVGLTVVRDWPRRAASPLRRWLFAALVIAAFCTVLSSLYMVAVLGVWFLIRCWETGARWWPALWAMTAAVLVAAAGTILFYLPAFIVSGLESYLHSRFLQPAAYYYVLPRLGELAARLGAYWGEGWPPALYAAVAVLALLGMAVTRAVPLPLAGVAVCATLTLAQRVFHFPRSFLFLSPLLLGFAAVGLTWIGTRLRRPAALPWVTAVVFVTAIGSVVQTRSVYFSNEIGNARDIRPAAEFLRSRLRPGDHVSLTLLSSMPAYYYFRKQGIPADVLRTPNYNAPRLFAVEDKPAPGAPEQADVEDRIMSNMDLVIRIEGYDADRLPPRQLLWESQWVRIWLYEPMPRL